MSDPKVCKQILVDITSDPSKATKSQRQEKKTLICNEMK